MSNSVEEVGENFEKMSIPSVSRVNDAGAETLTNVLPNEILLSIFRFLDFEDLLDVEQVCLRWKTAVETCLAAEKQLDLGSDSNSYSDSINRMRRYGPSMKSLIFQWHKEYDCANFNWVKEIANRFPNLLTLELWDNPIRDDDFQYLSTKCCHLNSVSLCHCKFTTEGLRVFLQALPGIKHLGIYASDDIPERRPQEHMLQPADASAVFSTCRNLMKFEMFGAVRGCDTASFSRFCKECVTLRTLDIEDSEMPKQMFAQIRNCSLLRELYLEDCPNVDDSTLIEISKGCPKLRDVTFLKLPLLSDRGLKCFARCKKLVSFCTGSEKMTDETLVELSKCVKLRQVTLDSCPLVSDRGCAALLAHCPRLKVLDVQGCEGVSNATVDSAIQAVKYRSNRLSLKLIVKDSSVTPENYQNCHPLLCLDDK